MNMTQFRQRLLAGFAITLLVIASRPAVADDVEWAMRMCSVINGMGAQATCAVTASENAVDVTIDTTAVDPAQFCAAYSEMLGALASMMTASWKIRVFSDETPDTPAAVCDLGQ
jgi:hypothetical protein